MIKNETQSRQEHVLRVAEAMMGAARTAPKSKGTDRLDIVVVWGDDLKLLADAMRRYSEKNKLQFFMRDAQNVEHADAVIVIGSGIGSFGLNCGYCGFQTCEKKNKHKQVPCALNSCDLGIALGSAASIAADNRVDSRVMFSIGKAALEAGILDGECLSAYGIALSCRGKSPFFDRVVY